MKLSELLKQYTDELINEYDNCDLNDLTEEQTDELMSQIHRTALRIIVRLSNEE